MIDAAATTLAVRVAQAATRRDCASRLINGIVAAARVVAAPVAGSTWVPVDVRGVFAAMAGYSRQCRLVAKSGCEGERWCQHGDPMGCNIKGEHHVPIYPWLGLVPGVPGADMPACEECNTRKGSRNPCVGSTPIIKKWWSCCCNGRLTVCVDCTTRAMTTTCICEYQAGNC
jgi:hypothetical protein